MRGSWLYLGDSGEPRRRALWWWSIETQAWKKLPPRVATSKGWQPNFLTYQNQKSWKITGRHNNKRLYYQHFQFKSCGLTWKPFKLRTPSKSPKHPRPHQRETTLKILVFFFFHAATALGIGFLKNIWKFNFSWWSGLDQPNMFFVSLSRYWA